MNSIAQQTNPPVPESPEEVAQTVLPHCRMLVPVPHPRVVSVKEVEMSCGVAFAAGVVVGESDAVIGVIENEGNGGATCFRSSGHPDYDRRWIEDFVAACQRDNEPGVMRLHGGGLLEEEVWDNLVYEFDTADMVAAATRKGRTLVRLAEQGRGTSSTFAELRGLPNRWSAVAVAAAMADQERPEGSHWAFWDGAGWQSADTTGESGTAPTSEGAVR